MSWFPQLAEQWFSTLIIIKIVLYSEGSYYSVYCIIDNSNNNNG